MKVFEDDKREKEHKLISFEKSKIILSRNPNFSPFHQGIDHLEEKFNLLKAEIEKIKDQKKQEIEEVSKRYEDIITVTPFCSHLS